MAKASLKSFARGKLTAGRGGVHLNHLHISQDSYIVLIFYRILCSIGLHQQSF